MMTRSASAANSSASSKPYAYIVEQPAKCGVRFRYECEGRISSAIPGASSTASRFTYPTVAVANYSGPIKILPYRPHPHNLVGKQFCSQGVCVALFGEPYAVFNNLGILCAKRKDVKERLRVREQLQIDPFGTGFSHRLHTFKLIDLNVVRLCFQVFLMDNLTGKYNIALDPVVSTEIFDKKAMSELSIAKLSHYSAHIGGGQSVVMLCDRVLKEDIQIRFYQTDCATGQTVWERMAHFNASDIHKHFAITFTVPPYELSGLGAGHHQQVVSIKSEFTQEDSHHHLTSYYQINQLSVEQEPHLFEQSPMHQYQHNEQIVYQNEQQHHLQQTAGSCSQILISPPEEYIWSSSEISMQQQQHQQPHHHHSNSPNSMLLDISQNVVRTEENGSSCSPQHFSFPHMAL
ncbi:hypothetical protein TYRP_019218 [Tyrophagus putrescentiae]|nr:hypothetical protein TYRP_019218 [Tyrophagus putrescentiae]